MYPREGRIKVKKGKNVVVVFRKLGIRSSYLESVTLSLHIYIYIYTNTHM